MELQSTEGQVLTRYPDHLRQEILPSKSLKLKIPSIGLRFYRKYSVITYLLMFFLFAVIGWCWEVAIHLVEDHIFVNRGTMMGPWLPIYGIGGTVGVFVMTVFGKKILRHTLVGLHGIFFKHQRTHMSRRHSYIRSRGMRGYLPYSSGIR